MKTKFYLFYMAISLVALAGLLSVALAAEDAAIYKEAVRYAQSGDRDFAFMYFRKILNEFPQSRYREEALFVKAEYYLLFPDFRGARKGFEDFLEEFPESDSKLFALANLFLIAEKRNDSKLQERIENEIITFTQVSLVFRDKKEYTFVSPLGRDYKAVFYINKIEFYVGEEIFATLVY